MAAVCVHTLLALGESPGHVLARPLTVSLAWMFRRAFYDQRIAAEVEGDALGDEYKG